MIFRSNQPGFVAEVKGQRHLPLYSFLSVCLSACLSICRRSICLCVNFYPSAIMQVDISWKQCANVWLARPAQTFFPQHFQHSFFLSQHCCFFAPVFLVHSLAVWVTLALQNMPPKARAPEARMVFGWDQVSGVEFCTCSRPSRCLPTTWLRQSYCYHQFKVRMYGIKLSSPANSFTHASMLPLPAPRLGKIQGAQLES